MATTSIKSYTSIGIDDLTDREFRFIEGYVISLNGQQAAVDAGYSPKSARAQASRLLSRTKVRRVIGVLKRRGLAKAELRQAEVLEHLKHCVTRTSDDFLDDDNRLKDHSEWNERAKASVDGIKHRTRTLKDSDGNVIGEEVEVEIKLVSKGGAITTAMKHFADQVSADDLANQSLDWDALYDPKQDSASTALLELEKLDEPIE